MKTLLGATLLTCSMLTLLTGCLEDSGGGSGGPELTGTYSGTVGRSSTTPIEFNLRQSGTEVTGTVNFEDYTYDLTGNLSGDSFDYSATNKSNPSYCKSLSSRGLTVPSDRSQFSGRITLSDRRCDGTGAITGGTTTFEVTRQ